MCTIIIAAALQIPVATCCFLVTYVFHGKLASKFNNASWVPCVRLRDIHAGKKNHRQVPVMALRVKILRTFFLIMINDLGGVAAPYKAMASLQFFEYI